jgi:hypothetical protein
MLGFVRRARAFSLVALIVMTGIVPASLSALLHDASDDALCQASIASGSGAPQIGAARTTSAEKGHCAVCHWLKSLRTALQSTGHTSLVTEFQPVVSSLRAAAGLAPVDGIPARAPPRA